MDKHSKITDRIFITNWHGSLDPDQLSANKIRYVLCMNSENTKQEEDHDVYRIMGIQHKYIKINDHPDACMYFHFPEIIEYMKNEKKGNILVHCTAGVSRSTTAVIAYLMFKVYSKGSPAKCRILPYIVSYVKKRRRWCNPNFGFLNQLYKFETHLIRASSK